MTRGARVTAADEVKLQFFMKLSDAQYGELDAKLLDVSSPASANYGKFLSGDDVTAEQLRAWCLDDAPRPEQRSPHEDALRTRLAERAVSAVSAAKISLARLASSPSW